MFQSFYPKPLDQFEIKCHRIVICVDCIMIHWNLSKANLLGTNFCVQNRQVFRLFGPRFPTFWLYLRRFLQDYILFRVLFKKVLLYAIFKPHGNSTWLPSLIMPSDWLKFHFQVSAWNLYLIGMCLPGMVLY
jgi:hypothetical protein